MLLGATPGMPPPARGPTAELWETRARRERPDRTAGPAGARTRRAPGAHTARSRHALLRATGTSCGVQPARLAACNRHVLWRATGTSFDVQPARHPACSPRVFRRATGASSGARSARLAARNRHASAACNLRRPAPPAHSDACKCARSICILNLSVFDSGFQSCDISPVGQPLCSITHMLIHITQCDTHFTNRDYNSSRYSFFV